jgi:hypothetical protein
VSDGHWSYLLWAIARFSIAARTVSIAPKTTDANDIVGRKQRIVGPMVDASPADARSKSFGAVPSRSRRGGPQRRILHIQ